MELSVLVKSLTIMILLLVHDMKTIPSLIDINECVEETDGCAQNCTNTIGSYICSCNTGYSLDSDRHSCYGKFVHCHDLHTSWDNGILHVIIHLWLQC